MHVLVSEQKSAGVFHALTVTVFTMHIDDDQQPVNDELVACRYPFPDERVVRALADKLNFAALRTV